MKTRTELLEEGVLLQGPVVPEWFKAYSDGCSVPTGPLKWLMRAKYGQAACYIHDYRYHMIVVAYPEGHPAREGQRMLADYELKQNRAATVRNPVVGWLLGKMYFRGVRIGGASNFKTRKEAVLRCPKDLHELSDFGLDVSTYYPDFDFEYAEAVIEEMADVYEILGDESN